MILFFIGSILSLAVAFVFFFAAFRPNPFAPLHKAARLFGFISLGYFILFILSFGWTFGLLVYNLADYIYLYSIVIAVQTLIFLRIFYYLSRMKYLYYSFFLYVICAFSLYISFSQFFALLLVVSSFLFIAGSLTFLFALPRYKRAGRCSFFYALASLAGTSLVFLDDSNFLVMSFVSMLALLLFLFYFIKDYPSYQPLITSLPSKEKPPYWILFVRDLTLILVMAGLSFLSTVVIHEFGHYIVSTFYGCTTQTILFQQNQYPHTEVFCSSPLAALVVTICGPLLPVLLGLVLFLLREPMLVNISFIIIGFNLLASYRDLQSLTLSGNLLVVSSILGIALIGLGIVQMARLKITERFGSIE